MHSTACVAPRRAWLAALVLAASGPGAATPYVPTSGSQVVEHVPVRADPAQRELARRRADLAKAPTDLPRAAALARRYIEQARIEGDPRYLGYAEAALAPWYKLAAPPTDVLVLRATLRQATHQFGPALADLDQVVRHDSDNAQAWLTRATVQMVTGDYAAASASCMRLYSRAPVLVVQACLSNIGSVSGHAASSYAALKAALARYPNAAPDLRLWAITLLAEMAARAGNAAADDWYRQALALAEPDSYLLGAYADFLLDHERAPEVVKLLKDRTRVDALLLRYALALRQAGSADAAAQADVLRARFEAAMLRGDTMHQREQARFELGLRNNARAAVRLAKLNWAVQKEPADLRILLATAVASDDREATRIAQAWIARTGIEDRTLDPLLRQANGKP
jgi:Tfp pilus assembly protein PilF